MVRRTRLDRWGVVERRMATLTDAERAHSGSRASCRSWPRPSSAASGSIWRCCSSSFKLLLATFGLPSGLVAIVAALFGTGAAHSMPVPAGIGVLEGAQMVLFAAIGYPAEVGLAVALAVRLRELIWLVPGLLYLVARGIAGLALRESVA